MRRRLASFLMTPGGAWCVLNIVLALLGALFDLTGHKPAGRLFVAASNISLGILWAVLIVTVVIGTVLFELQRRRERRQ